MTKVFIDTNVFLDLFLDRGEFADSAEKVLNWCEDGTIQGYTSAVNVCNIYYLVYLQKKNRAQTKEIVKKILAFIAIADTKRKDLLLAIDSDFADFEDAVQYYTSLNIDTVSYIITRNKKDYKKSTITVLTPEEFIKLHE